MKELHVELQSFLLLLLRGIDHIALWWFLHAKHITLESTLDENFHEWRPAFLVIQAVDGEYLLAVIVGKSQSGLDLRELILELT